MFRLPKQTTASGMQPTVFGLGSKSVLSVTDRLIPTDHEKQCELYRTIHRGDPIAGSAIDLMASLPFGEGYSLIGISDSKIQDIYQASCENISADTTASYMTTEMLITGKAIGSLVFNGTNGIFTDLIIQDPGCAEIIPIPLRGYEPKVNLKPPKELTNFLKSNDPRDIRAREELSDDLISILSKKKIELDPLTTIYVGRKTFAQDIGTSYLARIVPFYMLEQILLEGTMQAAKRRQRSVTHIAAGSETWDPSDEELTDLIEKVVTTNLDPVGAVLATKRDVEIAEIMQPGDTWKFTDEMEIFAQAKLRAMGISEAFLTGDACMTYDTIVPTVEFGLIEIGSFGTTTDINVLKPISITVNSRYKPEKTKAWVYNGKKPTLKVTTELGNSLKCTYNQPFLVQNGEEFEYKQADCLEVGNVVVIPLHKTFRTKQYEDRDIGIVTPDLARLIGKIQKTQNLESCVDLIDIAFNTDYNNADSMSRINVETTLETLGVFDSKVPNCILQADYITQLAYLSTALSIDNVVVFELGPINSQIQLMLFAMGIVSENKEKLTLSTIDSYILKCYILNNSISNSVIDNDKHMAEIVKPFLDRQFVFTTIANIEDNGTCDVFDFSMSEGVEPAFVANGICVHNTYSNMETALSVFMEMLRVLRSFVTTGMFTQKIFPILARVHRFIKRTPAELNHRIRVTGSNRKGGMIPLNELIIPEFRWHRQLQPKYDQAFLDIMAVAEEKGLPITLSQWAAACGINLQTTLNSLDDDYFIRQQIADWTEKKNKISGGGEAEEAAWSAKNRVSLKDIETIASKTQHNDTANNILQYVKRISPYSTGVRGLVGDYNYRGLKVA